MKRELIQLSWLVSLVALIGCRNGAAALPGELLSEGLEDSAQGFDSAPDSSSLDSSLSDSSAPKDTGELEEASTWCLGWESGTLEDAGYSGSQVELDDGALILAVVEGQEYSALIGEDQLDYFEEHALVLRSSHLGETQSVAVIQTSAFRVDQPQLWWWQLSEVRAEGIALEVELVEVVSSKILARRDIPIETGGFIPALQESHSPIEDFPEIDYGEPVLGSLVQQGIDMSAFEGMELALRISQHTRLEDNGFFTVLDQICLGRMAGPVLEWSEP